MKYYPVIRGSKPEVSYYVPVVDRECPTCGQPLARVLMLREYTPGRWRWEWQEQPALCSQDFIDGLDIT